MQRAIVIVLLFLSFGLKAQVYQAMPQAGYGPVKRFLTDSVLTIPTGINSLRNITGGRDAGQIRWNTTDSGFYVYSGTQWIKINIDSVSLSNRINGKLNISDTASMLSAYLRKGDTLSLSNRINLRVKYSDTAAMLLPYLRKLDTASLSDRINKKMDSLILTTIGTGGLATLLGTTLNIPNYGGALTGYVPYSGATNNVTLGSYNLTGTLLNADYSLQIKNEVGAGGASTLGYTSISSNNSGYYFYTSYTGGQKGAYFNYPTSGTTFSYNLPVRAGTIALVEDTVSLSNRINAKIGASDTVSLSNRINLKVNISDTASMLLPYLRKADTSSLSNRINLKLNASDTASLSNRINLKLNISDTASMLSNYQSAINARVKYSDTAAMLDPYLTAAVTSVGLSMPVAFSVANSPITSTGTLAVSAIGTAAQYIRGDGQLATLPSGSSGGSSVDYYLNGGTSQGTIGGSTYYEMSKDAVIGTNADFTRTNAQGNGLIAQFITDAGDPNRIEIPGGAWNFELFFSASSSGGSPSYYIELLKYDGTNFTSIASGSAVPELITTGTVTDLYLSSLAVPYTTLSVTDRLVIRVYVVTSGKTITLHTQDGHLCLITTTFAGGVSSLNGLTANTQYLAVGTSGTDFAISSVTDTHTFNLPTASATNRGALSSADWTTFNGKMNYTDTVSLSNRINTKLNSADTASLSNRINAKADELSGTTNTVPKFTSSTTIGNSNIKDNGNAVSINTTAGANGALQVGSYSGNILMNTDNSSGGLIFKNTSSSNKLWDFSSYNNDINFNESGVATPVITLQAGGNVGIKTITPAHQLEVNGTFKSGGIATFGSTLSNGTYGYTLPSATGTLALTSQLTSGTVTSIATGLGLSGGTITTSGTLLVDTSSASILSRQRAAATYATTSALSGYLPLTGGTLTGALGGTSATFSGLLTTGVTGNNTNAITFAAATSAKTHLGAGFGATFLQNNNYYNGSAYVFDDNTVGSSTITLGETIAFQTGAANTAPSTKLTIASTGAATFSSSVTATQGIFNASAGTYAGGSLILKSSAGTNPIYLTSNGGFFALSNGGGADHLLIASTGAATFSSNVNIGTNITASSSSIYKTTASSGYLALYGNGGGIYLGGSEDNQVFISSGGNVGIGTSSPSYTLHVNGSVAGTSAYNNLSDKRYKKDIKPIENALDKVLLLEGVTYNWNLDTTVIGDKNLDSLNHIGFVAQDIEKILPQVVSTANDKDKTKSVAYSDIVPVLAEAIKELSAQIKELQTKIQTLENK
jgi:hypothetical protein